MKIKLNRDNRVVMYGIEWVHMFVHLAMMFVPARIGNRWHDKNANWAFGLSRTNELELEGKTKHDHDSLAQYQVSGKDLENLTGVKNFYEVWWLHRKTGGQYKILLVSNTTALSIDYLLTATYANAYGEVFSKPLVRFLQGMTPIIECETVKI